MASGHIAAGVQGEQGDCPQHHHSQQDALLLAQQAEHQIAVRREDVFQTSPAQPYAEQPAAGHIGHDPGLLDAAVIGVLPHVPPGAEPIRHIGHEGENQEHAQGRCRHNQNDGAHAARAHEGDNQEGGEEDKRCAQVPHQEQETNAGPGEHQELCDIFLGLEPVQGGGAHKHKGNFNEL